MNIEMTTPALLFPAISLLLLAYTNRFLGLSTVIRNLHSSYAKQPDPRVVRQIENLRIRVYLVRNMQGLGVAAILCCVVCMFLIFAGAAQGAKWVFGAALVLMITSLFLSLVEISRSVRALEILLQNMEVAPKPPLDGNAAGPETAEPPLRPSTM